MVLVRKNRFWWWVLCAVGAILFIAQVVAQLSYATEAVLVSDGGRKLHDACTTETACVGAIMKWHGENRLLRIVACGEKSVPSSISYCELEKESRRRLIEFVTPRGEPQWKEAAAAYVKSWKNSQ